MYITNTVNKDIYIFVELWNKMMKIYKMKYIKIYIIQYTKWETHRQQAILIDLVNLWAII